jgi:Tfp pilus assembly protein PilX
MNANSPRQVSRQSGAVLVVSLIMLAVLTLFVISMLKTSIIELRIGGSSQTAAINLTAAESGVDNFLTLNSGRFAPGFLTAVGPAGLVAGSLTYTAPINAYGAAGTSVTLVANQIGCGSPRQVGEQIGTANFQAVQFDIASTATGALGIGGVAVVHQGVQSLAPSGSC